MRLEQICCDRQSRRQDDLVRIECACGGNDPLYSPLPNIEPGNLDACPDLSAIASDLFSEPLAQGSKAAAIIEQLLGPAARSASATQLQLVPEPDGGYLARSIAEFAD